MRITRRDQMAEATLRQVKKLVRGEKRLCAWVTPYENGREIGLVLHVMTRSYSKVEAHFTFSENRNSDDVVVYSGDFAVKLRREDKEGMAEADAMYEARRFFRSPVSAAHFIVSELRKTFSQVKKVS